MSERRDIRVSLLGTGTSTGIPVIGCTCRVCSSADQKDKRLRSSCHVQAGPVSLVIDTGPDFRAQAIRAKITGLDAVLITHHHFDHVVGLDDLRPFLFRNSDAIPCYAPASSSKVLLQSFDYIFADGTYPGVPRLTLESVEGPFEVVSRSNPDHRISVLPIPAVHGDIEVFGYRIGRFAYLTDVSQVQESSIELLTNLDVLVLDALRHEPHPKHLTIGQAIETATRIGADQTYFIHMTHSVLHAEEDERLPEGIALAYDGLSVDARW